MGLVSDFLISGVKPILVFFIIVSFVFYSCIAMERTPRRLLDDGSGGFKVSENGVLLVAPGVTILELSPGDLHELIGASEGIIYVWAPWCAPCYVDLKYNFDSKFAMQGDHLFVCVNYDLDNIVKLLDSKVDTAYVLSWETYGRNEMDKARGLSSFLIGRELDYIPQLYQYCNGDIALLK